MNKFDPFIIKDKNQGSPHCVVVNILDINIEVSKFELYYIHFQTYTLG